MNLGSHTPAQIAKLLPDLDARYRKAKEELAAAQANLATATEHVREAEQVLTEALARYLGNFPEHVVVQAVQPGACGCGQPHPPGARCAGVRLTIEPDAGLQGGQTAGDNGSGMVAER
jgi:hypothetical protein